MKHWVAFLLFVNASLNAQTDKLDSLLRSYQRASAVSVKAKLSYEIGLDYLNVNLDSSLVWANKALRLAQQAQQPEYEALAHLVRGHGITRQGSFARAYEAFAHALTIAEAHNLPSVQARALLAQGMVYNYLGDYTEALRVYRKAEQVAAATKNNAMLPVLYANIAGIYTNLFNYEQALVYRKKALENSYGSNQDRLKSSLSNIGRLYIDLGDYRQGLSYLFQSLRLVNQGQTCTQLYTLENIGMAYLKINHADSAIYFFEQGIRLSNVCNESIPLIDLLTSMGQAKTIQLKYAEAVTFLERAYGIASRVGAVRECARATQLLSAVYEKIGQPNKALTVYKEFQVLSDSIYSLDKITAFGREEASIEFELIQKNQEMAQKIEKLKQAAILNKEVRLRNTFIVSFVIALLFAGLYYYYFRRRKRYSQHLERLNQEIREQKEELQLLNEKLNGLNLDLEVKIAERTQEITQAHDLLLAKNVQLEEYAFFNAHKLRGPVSTILGLTHLFSNVMITEPERQEIINRIDESTQKLDAVVREIQQIVREQ